MAKYRVLKPYKDKELGRRLTQADKEVEMTVKRADEVNKTLEEQGFEGPFLERLDGPEKAEKSSKEEVEEELEDNQGD